MIEEEIATEVFFFFGATYFVRNLILICRFYFDSMKDFSRCINFPPSLRFFVRRWERRSLPIKPG